MSRANLGLDLVEEYDVVSVPTAAGPELDDHAVFRGRDLLVLQASGVGREVDL